MPDEDAHFRRETSCGIAPCVDQDVGELVHHTTIPFLPQEGKADLLVDLV